MQKVGKVDGQNRGKVGVVEEGDEVRDHEQKEDHPGKAAPRLDDKTDGGSDVCDGARRAAIGVADEQEHKADKDDQAAHEG